VSTWEVGQQVPLQQLVYAAGVLTNATVTLTVTRPGGTVDMPTVTTSATGTYDSIYSIVEAGVHTYAWHVTGAVPDDDIPGQFTAVTRSPIAYASLPDLKRALGIVQDTSRDELLLMALDSASRNIDRRCGRRFYADSGVTARTFRTRGRTLSTGDGLVFLVDDIASATGLIVELGSTASGAFYATDDVEVMPDNAAARGEPITGLLLPAGMWSALPTGRVRVTARWGWPAVPDEIEHATLLLAARLFRRKDTPEGVAGSAEWGVVRVASRDPDVEALIGPFMLPDIG
jgi:hypothetical protein